MVDISDMLFIVGHIWRSWETKLYETITRSNVFEVQSFREQIFLGRYWDFFWDGNFRDRYRDFFSRPKFSRPRPILSKNWEKSQYREVSRRDVTLCFKLHHSKILKNGSYFTMRCVYSSICLWNSPCDKKHPIGGLDIMHSDYLDT